MKVIRSLLDKLYEVPGLQRYKPIIGAADAILYGTNETTHAAPHVVDNIDIKRYMSFVILALLPAVAASVYFFGFRVIAIIMVSYMAGGAVEVIFAMVGKHDIHEGFLITGLIFPLVLPPTCPLWVVAIGVVFGTMFGKEMFGGTGRNIFNPALVGRLFITIAFPAIMSANWQQPFDYSLETDATTVATPLGKYKSTAMAGEVNPTVVEFKEDEANKQVLFTSAAAVEKCTLNPESKFDGVKIYCVGNGAYKKAAKHKRIEESNLTRLFSYGDLLVGKEPGSMGETCRIVIILGGIFLMFAKVSNWRIPVSYLGTVFVLALVGHRFLPQDIAPPVFQIFAGGLMFGAMFMATDPITSPFTKAGKYCFGVSCGVLTVLIRSFTGYVEGVMFSIVIMNAFTPLIDQIVLMFKYRPAKT
ncbi:MAG: RnfABCDGE type electron transport complex subunit D [Planctomycetes bacterium]|nr:RnfABCDGE type electron transport complex subunit D [Planctomycetota bacterium]